MKWIIWSTFPFTIFQIHYFGLWMTILPATTPEILHTSCSQRLAIVLCQMKNRSMFMSSRFSSLNYFTIKSEFQILKSSKRDSLTCGILCSNYLFQNKIEFSPFQIDNCCRHPNWSQNPKNPLSLDYNHQFG